jgi:hypothetical protein
MYSVTTQVLSMLEARERFEGIIDLETTIPVSPDGTLSGAELWLPGVCKDDPLPHYVLFVRAPECEKDALMEMCSRRLWGINVHSENLEHGESFMVMGTQEQGIYIPLWSAECLRIDERQSTIRVVLIGGDWVIDTRYHLSGDDFDVYTTDCMALMDSTGPHYNPERIYNEEELETAQGLSDDFAVPGRVVKLYAARGCDA